MAVSQAVWVCIQKAYTIACHPAPQGLKDINPHIAAPKEQDLTFNAKLLGQ